MFCESMKGYERLSELKLGKVRQYSFHVSLKFEILFFLKPYDSDFHNLKDLLGFIGIIHYSFVSVIGILFM